MKVENNHIYYTIDDIVDLLDALKVDGANKLVEEANEKDNLALKYAVVGYNSAMRKIRRDFEAIDDQFRKEIKTAQYGMTDSNEAVPSEANTEPQDHTEMQEDDITQEQSTVPEEVQESAPAANSDFAPI